MDYFTEIKIVIQYPERLSGGKRHEWTAKRQEWDPELTTMREMFDGLLKAMGFALPEEDDDVS